MVKCHPGPGTCLFLKDQGWCGLVVVDINYVLPKNMLEGFERDICRTRNVAGEQASIDEILVQICINVFQLWQYEC